MLCPSGLKRLAMAVALIMLPASVISAAERSIKRGPYNPEDASVEMFEAIAAKQIAVKLIQKDSAEARVFIENKTNQPLNVRLPEAFVGVPVLAQFGGGFGAQGGFGGGGGGGNQTTGGGFGGGGGGLGGAGGGAGANFFNVPAERVGEIKLTTVCLEHGKDDPRPAITYDLKPVTAFSDKPEVYEICKLVGEGAYPQRVLQAAAWHISNDMSFQELAAKQINRLNGVSYPYFHPKEVMAASQVAAIAGTRAANRPAETQASLASEPLSQQ